MKARREPAKSKVSSKSRPHVRPRRGIAAADLWVLRIMAQFSPRLLKNLDLDCEPLQRLLRYRNGEGDALSAPQLGKRVKTLLEDAEQRPVRHNTTVDRRLRKISELLALDAVERDVLAFFVAAELGSLKIVVGHVAQLAMVQLTEVLGKTLKIPKNRIGAALHRRGTLRASGLVDLDGDDRLFRQVNLAPALGETIYSTHGSITDIFSSFFAPAPAAARTLGDFAYLKADQTLISRTLDAAMNERRAGANVLLYGAPGTGKTELVRVLAKHLGAELYEVSHQDADNDSLSGWQRFRHYMLCQRVLSRKPRTLILFDEIEDVIPHHLSLLFSGEKEHGKRKAWINKLLETNGTPAVWVSNRVDYIDPAILRRFDHLLEIPVPPLRARERIVRKYGARLGITADAARAIARNEKLTPADMERPSKVVALADFDADSDSDSTCKALVRVINNSMIAHGKPLVSLGATSVVMGEYRHDAANCDQNLDELADALKARPHARLCLHGPPGTGKTAFVKSLADACGTPLVQKKASDLLSAWLGDTEANIAHMFHEAQRQQAILLLDEADSFLQDRRRAQRSWEITQVNELLVQMENFDGLFFCCTNLMENLDEASLRRFDIKVRFDFLKPDQVWLLFRAHLEHARCPVPFGKNAVFIRAQLSTLSLTPGDYAAIARRMHVLGRAVTPESLLDELRSEASYKPGFKRHSVGFV